MLQLSCHAATACCSLGSVLVRAAVARHCRASHSAAAPLLAVCEVGPRVGTTADTVSAVRCFVAGAALVQRSRCKQAGCRARAVHLWGWLRVSHLWDTRCCHVLQAGAPIYVRKSVWESCATPLRNSSTWPAVNHIQQEGERRAGIGGSGGGSSGERRGG